VDGNQTLEEYCSIKHTYTPNAFVKTSVSLLRKNRNIWLDLCLAFGTILQNVTCETQGMINRNSKICAFLGWWEYHRSVKWRESLLYAKLHENVDIYYMITIFGWYVSRSGLYRMTSAVIVGCFDWLCRYCIGLYYTRRPAECVLLTQTDLLILHETSNAE